MKRFTVNSNVSIASYQLWIYWFSNFLHPFKVKSKTWTILASRMKYLLSRTTGSKTPQSHECLQTPLGSSGRPRYLSDISLFLSALSTLCVNISLESFAAFRRLKNTPIGQVCFLRPQKAPISFRYIALFVSVRHSNTHMTTSFKRHISRHTFDKQKVKSNLTQEEQK